MIQPMLLCITLLLMLKSVHTFIDTSNNMDFTDINDTTIHDYLGKLSKMHLKAIRHLDFSLLPIIFAESKYLSDGRCKNNARMFLRELQNGTLWAVQMYDSSAKYPEGLIYGNTRNFGNFDECYDLKVNMPDEDVDEINGRYCLVDIEYHKKNASLISKSPIPEFDPHDSFWEAVEERHDFTRIPRYRLQMAVCVPSSCSAKDLETALKIPLKEIGDSNNIILQTRVQSQFCQTAKEIPQFTTSAKIYCAVLLIIFIIVICATWYDNGTNENENNQKLILHFSAKRSFKKIFHVSYVHPGLDSIYSIRCFLIFCMVLVHRYLIYIFIPTTNITAFEELHKAPLGMIWMNGNVTIDVFFTLMAILMSYKLLEILDRTKRFFIFRNIAIQYLRLTPTLLIIMCFTILILPLLGSGPFWKDVIKAEALNCATNWWTNLLYINNYVNRDKMCIPTTWFMAAGFQQFVFGQFILYAFWHMSRKRGYSFLVILTLGSCIYPFVLTYIYNVVPAYRITPTILQLPEMLRDLSFSHYVSTHMRFTAYLIGIITGAILYDYRNSTYQLSTFWTHVLAIPIPFILCTICQFWARKFYIPYINWNPLEGAIFSIFQRISIPLSACFSIIILTFGSRHDYYYYFHLAAWAQPLSKLLYGVILTHFVLLMTYFAQVRSARTMATYEVLSDSIGTFLFSSLITLIIKVCIDEPIRSIVKQLLIVKTIKSEINERKSDDNIKKIQ